MMVIITTIYFSVNSYIVGRFYNWNEKFNYKDYFIIVAFLIFAVPMLLVLGLWELLKKALTKLDVFFYYNLYFTDKFKDLPEEWYLEDGKYINAIKKKYGRNK